MKRSSGVANHQHRPLSLALALFAGVLLGSTVSLWKSGSASPQPCPVCKAFEATALALPGARQGVNADPSGPVGGIWTPVGREKLGNAELEQLLKRIAVNNEVVVAGLCERWRSWLVRSLVLQCPTTRW